VVAGVVAVIGPEAGPVVDVRLDCSGETLVARLTRYSVAQLGLRPGTPVFALVKSVSFDRRSLSGLLRTGGAEDGVVDA
jgi:molybdate transport system ATP-binding protein